MESAGERPVRRRAGRAAVGVYSDFRGLDTQSLRVTGPALAVMAFDQAVKVKFGVWYLDRVRYKLFPVGGIVWTPNADTRFDILFPNPKFTQRLQSFGNTEWWWYASGDYGGDAWTVRRGKESGAVIPGRWTRWTTTTSASPWAWSSSD